ADVTEYWHLSDDLVPIDLPVTDSIPEDDLRVCLIDAQPSCDSDSFFIAATHCPAHHPETPLRAISDLSPQRSGERLGTHPTNPCIGFTAALSGNTLPASTFSASPN